MGDIKTRVQGIDPNVKAVDVSELAKRAVNLYEAITIIEKRARQLNVEIKHELHAKLEDFAIVSDRIEEIQENKEQIEISKFYEKLPNPAIIATAEFVADQLMVSKIDREEFED